MTKLHDLIRWGDKEGAIDLIKNGDRAANFKAFLMRIPNFYTHGHYNQAGITALQFATNLGYDDVVRAMLENHANPNMKTKCGQPSLHALAMINHRHRYPYGDHPGGHRTLYPRCIDNIIRAYVAHGVNINEGDQIKRTALHYASGDINVVFVGEQKNMISAPKCIFVGDRGEGHISVVRGLLINGAIVDSVDDFGFTPLFFAASTRGNAHIVECLIKNGANPDARDKFRSTPLHYAVASRSIDTVIALINNGADVNAINDGGDTPLHLICGFNNNGGESELELVLRERIALHLLAANAQPNIQDARGRTALHLVGYRNKTSLINAFLIAGADATITDNKGAKPIIDHAYVVPELDINNIFHKQAYFYLAGYQKVYLTNQWGPNSLGYKHITARGYDRRFEPYVAEEYVNREPPVLNQHGMIVHAQPWFYNEYAIDLYMQQPVAERRPIIQRELVKQDVVYTHTESIHATVSKSAINLQNAFPGSWFNSNHNPKAEIENFLSDAVIVEKLGKLIFAAKSLAGKDISQAPSNEGIIEYVNIAITNVTDSKYYDPVSRVTLKELLIIIQRGIASLPSQEQRNDGLLKLCEHLYLAAQENICEPGYFNTMVYSQQSILSGVHIEVQTKEFAAATLMNKLKHFVTEVYINGQPDNVQEFKQAVSEKADRKQCLQIATEVMSEYYTIFRFETAAGAKKANESSLNSKFNDFAGMDIPQMFDYVDLDIMFVELSKKHPKPKETRPNPSPITFTRDRLREARTPFLDRLENGDAEFVFIPDHFKMP